MSDGPRAPVPLGLQATQALGPASEPGAASSPTAVVSPSAVAAAAAAASAALSAAPASPGVTLPGVGAEPTIRDGLLMAPAGVGELRPGDHVGRYVIERKVGAGGMGEVYAAHDPQLDRRVAIKVLRPTGRAADAAARLVREAQALAKLAHPNVVAVYDVGEADQRVFLAMQFVEGWTLAEHIARTRLRWDEIVTMYVAAGRGLAAAHAAGLIHRDMKPSNVLVDRAGRVAVTDFGVARASDDFATPAPLVSWSGPRTASAGGEMPSGRSALSTDMTQAGAVIGTPPYMAPEQHAGQRASAKSDQFGFCVSVWQGLFGKHPFVPDDHDEETSPFEYMALITDGELIPPRKGHGVPRRVVAALTRGLARAPEARWPSMNALLAALEPRTGTRTTVIALGTLAALGAGAAVWFALADRGGVDRGPSCATQIAARVETAWSPVGAAQVTAGFAASGRSYGTVTAQATAASLDHYAQRWSALATDACAGATGTDPAGRQLATARAQCLDRSLGALRSVATMLGAAPRGELVDNALAVVAGLPDLDDCTDPATLLATGVPPPARAPEIIALEDRLATANAKHDAGLSRESIGELQALVTEADATGWVPLRVRVRISLGDSQVGALSPATPVLVEAAQLATEHGLVRDAARAWAVVVQSAGLARKPDAVDAYAAIAQAAAAASHDPELINRVRIYQGRALSRMRRFADAEPLCRAALAEARTRPGVDWRELGAARDCVLELLAPLGQWAEAMTLAEEAIAARTAVINPEHPAVADYLSVIGRVQRNQGKLEEARRSHERARDIRVRAYGTQSFRYAESLEDLAWFEPLERRRVLLEEALAIATAPAAANPRTPLLEYAIERSLADVAGRVGDAAAMQRHFERALTLAEATAGARSIDVGMLLIGYGQYLSEVDMSRSLATLRRAVEILDGLRDKRVQVARGALALILIKYQRHAEALPVLEQAVAAADLANIEPFNLAMMRFNLADALVRTGGDRARARALALEAAAGYRSIGPEEGGQLARVEAWLKQHR